MSKRKPHNMDSGYVAERIYHASGSHIVIYVASKQQIDAGGAKYAVVCSQHGTICGASSVPRARVLMKYPEFCEACMSSRPNI